MEYKSSWFISASIEVQKMALFACSATELERFQVATSSASFFAFSMVSSK
jgi:hypothetical protein